MRSSISGRLALAVAVWASIASVRAADNVTPAKIALASQFLENEGLFDFANKGPALARLPAITDQKLFIIAYRTAIERRRLQIEQVNKALAEDIAQSVTTENLKILIHDQERPVMQSIRAKRAAFDRSLLEGHGRPPVLAPAFTKQEQSALRKHQSLVQSLSTATDQKSGLQFAADSLKIVLESQLEALTNYCKMGGNCRTEAFRKTFPKIHP